MFFACIICSLNMSTRCFVPLLLSLFGCIPFPFDYFGISCFWIKRGNVALNNNRKKWLCYYVEFVTHSFFILAEEWWGERERGTSVHTHKSNRKMIIYGETTPFDHIFHPPSLRSTGTHRKSRLNFEYSLLLILFIPFLNGLMHCRELRGRTHDVERECMIE